MSDAHAGTVDFVSLSSYSDTAVYAANKILPSIVGIEVTYNVTQNSMFSFFGGNSPSTSEAKASGSGIIISEDGYILTNNHVVDSKSESTYYDISEATSVKVSLSNGDSKTYDAKITFNANSKYAKSTKTVSVKVTKATPKLTAKAKTFKKSLKTKKYAVSLKTNQNKVMKNTKITLKVNGKTYSATTNSKGQAIFKITKLTKKGGFTATIKYAGSKYYNAKTVKAKIVVK